MKRFSIYILLVAVATAGLAAGCRDDNDPEYWLDQMYDRPWREESLKKLNTLFSKTMQENGNDLENPKVHELVEIMAPALVEGYREFKRDKFNRLEIVKLLAQMKHDASKDVFLSGLALEDTSASQMFIVSSNAVKRQGLDEALPSLLNGYKKCTDARSRRPGAPFTTTENEIVQAVISASSAIMRKNPTSSHKAAVVKMLGEIAETPDTLQELRLNMKALKGLGKIGDPSSVPVLIKGIAIKGKRQPIGLGQIAFAALQQIRDRDVVVEAIIKFAEGKDPEFNQYFADEIKNDPLMKNPNWYRQQAVNFLGSLNYGSPRVLKFLEADLNHTEPDAADAKAAAIVGLPVNFEASGWATMRRNWAAVALANIGHAPLMNVIKKRVVIEKNAIKTEAEETVGYVRAMGLLQMPKESCPLLLSVAKAGDDSMRDKTFYNAALMCGDSFDSIMKKSLKKINCDKIVQERFPDGASEDDEKQARNECNIMKKRIEGYMARIEFGKKCGSDVECYAKVVADHSSSNVERAINSLYRIGRDDESKRDQIVKILMKELHNPSKVALAANIYALDHLTPNGSDALIARIQEIYRNFARQSAYKDRARMLESFIGHVRNRMGK